ncbi:unnamed protein product [Rhizoctonia solani]|uniref:Uncharacterized protein n=1 Tax=Rhizoctonia solani TaxID=456999 RepID=A0A8H3HAV9_9AGAM|nr:unnamed protein product [Rhizoctonia solani]
MPLSPGLYKIHDTDSDRVLTYYSSNKIGTGVNCDASYAKWYVKYYPGSLRYGIQVMEYNKYLAVTVDGSIPYGVEEDDASVLELEHQFHDFYLIKLAGTRYYLEHPNIGPDGTIVKFVDKVAFKGPNSGDTGSILKPKTNNTIPTPLILRPNDILSRGSGSQYTDDAHFHTDILFNMPRNPFTRNQRMATLEWARKLGVSNVPTMESFDECERRLEVALGKGNNTA